MTFTRSVAPLIRSLLLAGLLQTGTVEGFAQAGPASDDPRLETIQRLAIPLATIDPTADDVSDLEPLLDLIGDRRAVLLGEASHSAGSDFLAKTRIVRFLHERLGFDILAFESPAWGMRLVMDSIRSGSIPPDSAFALGAWGHYAVPVQMDPLFNYVARSGATSRPLRLAGFDNQFLGRGQLAGFPDDLARVLEERGIPSPIRDADSPERAVLDLISVMAYRRDEAPPPRPEARTRLLAALEDARDAMASLDDEESRWWSMILEGTACHADRVFVLLDEGEASEGGEEPSGSCGRNASMARQALWLLESDPSAKVVLWAHNAHVMRLSDGALVDSEFGEIVQTTLGSDAYTMILTSYEGAHGFPSAAPYPIVEDQVPEVELEELLAETDWPAAIVPLAPSAPGDEWLTRPFFARPIHYEAESQPWAHRADAFLYIRTQDKSRSRDAR